MVIPNEVWNYAKNKAQDISHGKIIIEINENSGKVYVVAESRKRFFNNEKKSFNVTGKREMRHG